jgi:hypothetical protein
MTQNNGLVMQTFDEDLDALFTYLRTVAVPVGFERRLIEDCLREVPERCKIRTQSWLKILSIWFQKL